MGEAALAISFSILPMKASFIAFLPLFVFISPSSIAHAAKPAHSLAHTALQKIDPEIKPDHYDIARADLNGDGKDDVLAFMNGKSSYCGSGGCTLFVLKGSDAGFESLGSIKVVNAPMYLRKASTQGMRDLLVTVRGGGSSTGLSTLKFDGKRYPAAPGDERSNISTDDTVLFAEPTAPYDQKQEHQGISFHVLSPNRNTGNSLTVTPSGLENDNTPITLDVAGIVTNAEVADINVDGSPELYVSIHNGSGTTLLAWSANKEKSLSSITLAELGDSAKGYRGGDEFSVVEGIMARRFPIYPADPAEAKPTGKTRQIQYKLHAGEAGWLLKVDKVIEF